MHKFLFILGTLIIAGSLFLSACNDQINPASALDENEFEGSIDHFDKNAEANKAIHQESNVFKWPPVDPEQISGASATLVRNKNGARLKIQTNDLEPGHAHSVWMVVFDAPENCVVPNECGLDDIMPIIEDPDAPNPHEATVFGAVGGGLAGGNGQVTFAGHTKPGDEANDVLFGDGSLDNPLTAEVHFVIRTHGPAIPGMIREQISTFNGGCEEGEPNEGLCDDLQFGIFLPPE